jgi:hypothetical protein
MIKHTLPIKKSVYERNDLKINGDPDIVSSFDEDSVSDDHDQNDPISSTIFEGGDVSNEAEEREKKKTKKFEMQKKSRKQLYGGLASIKIVDQAIGFYRRQNQEAGEKDTSPENR